MGTLKHYIVPLFMILIQPVLMHILANFPRDEGLRGFSFKMLFGNAFSWIVVIAWMIWCAFFLMIPFDRYKGPQTASGHHPEYSHNCAPLYFVTFVIYLGLHTLWPDLSTRIYVNFPYIVGTTNIMGFVLSGYFWWKGKHHPDVEQQPEDRPMLYEFYQGLELHPRMLNIDVKQWLLTRIAFMGWLLLIFSFTMASYFKEGFSSGILVNFLLQLYYLHNFFDWEPAYLTTPSVTDTRVGFQLIWGSLNWTTTLYTYSTYYFVNHPPETPYLHSLGILLLGVAIITIRYMIDNEKDLFKEANGNCIIWGKKATFIEVEYQTSTGIKKSRLLTSGFWAFARHMNYLFEILGALCWSVIGYPTESIHPFLYVIGLTVLLFLRIFKDEAKCSKKYGIYWNHYCKIVKYRMIPYVF